MPSPEQPQPLADTPETTPPATPAAPALDTTNFVSREDYARLEGMLAQQGAILQQIAGGQQRVVQQPEPTGPRYTDDQLAEMLESGDGRKILEAQRYIANQQMAPFAREFVEFRGQTVQTAAQFNREIAEARGTMPHASDAGVRRSMDEFLAKLPAEAHANPEALQLAYAQAIARPENFQRLMKQEVEAELRRRAGGDETVLPPAGGARSRERVPETPGSTVPTVSELLGPDAANAIRAQGYTNVDDWVRKSQRGRFKNWKEYAASIQEQQAREAEFNPDDIDPRLQ